MVAYDREILRWVKTIIKTMVNSFVIWDDERPDKGSPGSIGMYSRGLMVNKVNLVLAKERRLIAL
jgi:hypothetical protein